MSKIIGVTGFSGSGKSTFCRLLSEKLDCTVISQDDFYIGREVMAVRGIDPNNFDVPQALDVDAIKVLYRKLKKNRHYEGQIPQYDYITQSVIGKKELKIKRNVIVDGHLIHTIDSLFLYVDLLIYIDVPASVAKLRRISRDTSHRGFTNDECEDYYTKYVAPSNSVILNLKKKADYVVNAIGKEKNYFPHLSILIDKINEVAG